ncbi:SDR family NAD(P)-dependent oxidoreductase [Planococcus glaciei]|uniref:SDR family NAD(P)-dependent oxidoreductase n=1 Tax=Planococcus glaciei TaxID=459472 RepID=UPI001C73A170|nr:SDR family oxidoreductase [Planococcus glaciei]MBX0314754.1 SDR family oxidoreductase [Planococcus glaciei]
MQLAGKVAIVTGGASGIGLATVKALLDKGAHVVIADINVEGGEAAAKELQNNETEVAFVEFDASKEQSVKNLVAEAVRRFGRLDIMVNNAGIRATGETHELSYEDYRKVIAVNQDGVFFGSKFAILEMLKTGGGAIVNTASILGTVGEANAFAVTASKGAVNLMTKSLALKYADKNIRVNAVSPGYIETGMSNRSTLSPESYERIIAKHPIGRLGQPEEVAHAIIFLCENEFVTGSTVMVDGGYTAQ